MLLSGSVNVKNWGGSCVDYTTQDLDPLTIAVTDPMYKQKAYACRGCLIHCGAFYDLKNDSQYGIKDTTRPEYETYSSFATATMCKDPQTVFYANHICNEYGMDTITCGTLIAWVMECYEHGVLTKDDLDGIEAIWGSNEAIKALLDKLCKDEGCGKILKLGTKHAALAFGKGMEYAMLAGGMEIGQHDPRREIGTGRVYAYDPTPGRHMRGGLGGGYRELKFDGTGYADVCAMSDNEVVQNGGFCLFGRAAVPPGHFMNYINAATGFNYTKQEFYFLGIRSFFMRQAFNLREGQRRKDWTVSPRLIGNPPLKEGANEGRTNNIKKLGDNFYEALGCDKKTGVPLKQALELTGGLEMVIQDLYK